MKRLVLALAAMLVVGHGQLAIGQGVSDGTAPRSSADVAARAQTQLESRYALSKMTSDGTNIVATGAVVVLQRDNLMMNKVLLSRGQKSSPVGNVYGNG